LLAAGAAGAQVSVGIGNDGSVQVTTNGTSVAVPGGGNAAVQRSYQVQSGNGTVIQRNYQYQGGDGVSRSYQYQSGSSGSGYVDLDDALLAESPSYLVLRAAPGQVLRGQVRVNGRTVSSLGRQTLVIPLADLLRPGANRIELSGPSAGVWAGVLLEDDGWPALRGGRPYGAERLLYERVGPLRQTIVLRVR
jgi:hypothetical protein